VFAQPVSIGVKGGLPINDALETAQGLNPFGSVYLVNNHRYLVGGTIQFNFPGRFSIEVDGLYRRVGFQHSVTNTPPAIGTTVTSTTANSWEFPVLGKFAILPGHVRPFVDAGANFRRISNVTTTSILTTIPELDKDFAAGFTFGGGIEFKFERLRVSPEIRFTHWGTENFHDPVNSLLHTNQNQGDFMLGITF